MKLLPLILLGALASSASAQEEPLTPAEEVDNCLGH